jgi:hypothetical protein
LRQTQLLTIVAADRLLHGLSLARLLLLRDWLLHDWLLLLWWWLLLHLLRLLRLDDTLWRLRLRLRLWLLLLLSLLLRLCLHGLLLYLLSAGCWSHTRCWLGGGEIAQLVECALSRCEESHSLHILHLSQHARLTEQRQIICQICTLQCVLKGQWRQGNLIHLRKVAHKVDSINTGAHVSDKYNNHITECR